MTHLRRTFLLALAAGLLLVMAGCRPDDAPREDRSETADAAAPDRSRASARAAPTADETATPSVRRIDLDELGAASHILVAYEGCAAAPAGVARSRSEASDLARRILVLMRTNRAWFEDLARKYSDDARTAERGGYLGTFRRGELLPAFERALFRLDIGELGGPVETPYGFHVIRREPVRRIQAQHILVAWRGAQKTGHEVSRSRERALEIARKVHDEAVAEPEEFCDLALRYSDDPNNRTTCGTLGSVEPGELSPDIESVLFRLKPGEVSDVVESVYGFHVFRRQ